MRQIAYKTANHSKSVVKGTLPDDYITEFTFVDMHPENSLNDEWKIINEDEFQKLVLISNSEEKVKEHHIKLNKQYNDEFNVMIVENERKQVEKDLEKAAYEVEFEEFIAWKKSKKDK
jgi:hypothetical protein